MGCNNFLNYLKCWNVHVQANSKVLQMYTYLWNFSYRGPTQNFCDFYCLQPWGPVKESPIVKDMINMFGWLTLILLPKTHIQFWVNFNSKSWVDFTSRRRCHYSSSKMYLNSTIFDVISAQRVYIQVTKTMHHKYKPNFNSRKLLIASILY